MGRSSWQLVSSRWVSPLSVWRVQEGKNQGLQTQKPNGAKQPAAALRGPPWATLGRLHFPYPLLIFKGWPPIQIFKQHSMR